MEGVLMMGSAAAVSMATPFALSRGLEMGATAGRRAFGFGVERSTAGGVVAVPQRRRSVVRMCMGEVRLADELVDLVSEIDSASVPSKLPKFPLLDLYDFICGGPLLKKVGFTEESVAQRIDEWLSLGVKLSRQLRFDEFGLSQSEKVRIYHYYVPVFLWCKKELDVHTSKYKEGEEVPPLVIGISAPQGCGKTTIVYSLEYLFNSLGSKAASISIDDFYLTASELKKVSESNPGNRLLEMRGNAGSHDLQLGTETLNALRSLTTSGKEIKLPRYDKSAFAGLGDRADPSEWSKIEGPVKVVLFEGWMLGFEPEQESAVTAVDPQLAPVNKNLEAYYDAWHKMIDSWVVIEVDDPSWVFVWRLQAEIAMRADGRAGLTDEQVADFVSRYMPAYKAYLPSLYAQGPKSAKKEHTLMLQIDENRNPIG
ncbi:hypothetical protein M758_8G069100 [Ceratodon purpureus]|nr:hypothetical protein M758_8G069100 [Ceratodon purpureus]